MDEIERNIAEQVAVYGEPLADVFGRLTRGLGLNQAGLAKVLGISPPMLSQLGSGRRIKIGNPAVMRRLEEVRDLLTAVEEGKVGEHGIPGRLEQIRESVGGWTTTRHELSADTGEAAAHQALRSAATPAELADAAGLLAPHHPKLADLLRAAAGLQR
ncbi:helix-turn-helix domain-containing protein [Ornithinimicrobium panacihumi]|uniref:helix-turn-helix domain-containing protein n=1 Tax=Ornithinimicrobium panacihumi TaxID=2008449 RepID=UPI003F8BFB8D